MSKGSQAAKSAVLLFPQPALQLIYDTASIGLACLSPDCRYLQINQHLTEICGISIEDHLGRWVRACVPALADSVEAIVRSIMETGEPVTGIEVAGQRADRTDERFWITYWHPLRSPGDEIVGMSRICWAAGSSSIVSPAREPKFNSSYREWRRRSLAR